MKFFLVVHMPMLKLSKAKRWSYLFQWGFEPEHSVHSSNSESPKTELRYISDECLLGLVDLIRCIDIQIFNPVFVLFGNVLY